VGGSGTGRITRTGMRRNWLLLLMLVLVALSVIYVSNVIVYRLHNPAPADHRTRRGERPPDPP
jgi:hypothetical protein